MIGSTIKVVVTAENGNTFESEETEAVTDIELGDIEIVSAEAIQANKIEVTLANAVISTDVDIEVMKGTNEIDVTASWSEDFDSVVLTTPTNMSAGTYTVTLTSIEDPTDTDFADFEVEAQKVETIVILNETALTNKDELDDNPATDTKHTEAYAYYDVLDQYGESVRTSASIQWSGSAEVEANKATGLLKLTKSGDENKAWVYGEKIYLTGVYTKTGTATTAELTVGTEQALDTIAVAGFVKKNTTDLELTLPADFKSNEWYLLFNAYDQNGNPIEAGGFEDGDINIISDNVLVVASVKGVEENPISIDDVEYNAVLVEPGIKVADGGLVNFTAIATRTGNKTEYQCLVGVDQVIVSFTMSAPTGTVADGEEVEIPYVALDEDGESVTDFVTIAKHEIFNALTLTVGGNGELYLAEQNDGSAKLFYADEDIEWTDSKATDGIDRPVSLTAVVLGGETDNQMISISDKARPDAIKDVDLDDVYVEGAPITLSIADIEFYDQYGRDMGDFGDDNDFFAANFYAGGRDFNDYHFSVRATYTGNGGLYVSDGGEAPFDGEAGDTLLAATPKSGWILDNGNTIAADLGFGVVDGVADAAVFTKEDVKSSRSNEGFKFEIVKVADGDEGDAEEYEVTSRAKSKLFTIVDVKAVKNFAIKDLGTLYLGATAQTGSDKIAIGAKDDLQGDTLVAFDSEHITSDLGIGADGENDYQSEIEVTGTYNGKPVTIPSNYFVAAGNKVAATAGVIDTIIPYDVDDPENITEEDTPNGLTIQDLYDKTSSQGVAKLAEDTIKAVIFDIYGEYAALNDALPEGITATTMKAKDDEGVDALTEDATADDLKKDLELGNTYEDAIATITAAIGTVEAYVPAEYEGAEAADLSVIATTAQDEVIEDLTELLLTLQMATGILPEVVDSASAGVYLSDQAPKASSFSGLADEYTFAPLITAINDDVADNGVNAKLVKVKVLDQYGVELDVTIADISKKASSVEESEDGYVDNNFTTSGNNSTDLSITGAERGDTFVLTLSYQGVEGSTNVTVGADKAAEISSAFGNTYINLLVKELETQRKAILGVVEEG